MQTPRDLFRSKEDFMDACRLAAVRGLISVGSVPGSVLDRFGWAGVNRYIEDFDIPWEDLKREVESRPHTEIFHEYNNFACAYEQARLSALQQGKHLRSEDFAMQVISGTGPVG